VDDATQKELKAPHPAVGGGFPPADATQKELKVFNDLNSINDQVLHGSNLERIERHCYIR